MKACRALLLMAAWALPCAVWATPAAVPPAFSVSGLAGWSLKPFKQRPETAYTLAAVEGKQVVHAVCRNSAAGLVWKGDVNLNKTPVLHWRWKVAHVYTGLNQQIKAGDDFPARVYVVTGSRWLPWTLRSLSYVWSSAADVASAWNSPYTDQARMIPVERGAAHAGQWRSESRNVRADFKRVFGSDIGSIGAVAIMTDCDDSHRHDQAWYGNLYFAAR